MGFAMGFITGALAGTIFAGLLSVLLVIRRRAPAPDSSPPQEAVSAPAPSRPETVAAQAGPPTAAPPTASSRTTVVVGSIEAQEGRLNESLQDVRDLLLRLADVVGRTDDASGLAVAAFTSARSAIDKIPLDKNTDLLGVQQLLIKEIDRVLKINASLQVELDRAHQGIAEQRRQIEDLRVAARVDSLTRIPNRTAFDERLGEYISLLDRAQIIFTLLLLDIDHFKQINDTYGHLNGDRILRGVATKITECIRANDFAARYGGEEFAVIFPSTGVNEARVMAERIRQDIAKTNFRLDERIINLTISGGMAECKERLSAEQIIKKADRALYLSKEGGRNCIYRSE